MASDKLGGEVGAVVGERLAGEQGEQVGRIVGSGVETMLREAVKSAQD